MRMHVTLDTPVSLIRITRVFDVSSIREVSFIWRLKWGSHGILFGAPRDNWKAVRVITTSLRLAPC